MTSFSSSLPSHTLFLPLWFCLIVFRMSLWRARHVQCCVSGKELSVSGWVCRRPWRHCLLQYLGHLLFLVFHSLRVQKNIWLLWSLPQHMLCCGSCIGALSRLRTAVELALQSSSLALKSQEPNNPVVTNSSVFATSFVFPLKSSLLDLFSSVDSFLPWAHSVLAFLSVVYG